jgi:hypothetical protein
MAAEARFSSRVMVILFAGAVVALGLNEIHQRVVKKASPVRVELPNLIEELHGVSRFEKERYSAAVVEPVPGPDRSAPAKKGAKEQEWRLTRWVRRLLLPQS